MIKPKLQRSRSSGRDKKNVVPLYKLRASVAIRTVVDHPRRLEELMNSLRDKERSIRGKASAMIARFSETHPARLVRHLERLREALEDDSAFVRWHILHSLGQIVCLSPVRAAIALPDVKARLTDEDRLVRCFAHRALETVAAHRPQIIKEMYAAHPEEMPVSVSRILSASTRRGTGRTKG